MPYDHGIIIPGLWAAEKVRGNVHELLDGHGREMSSVFFSGYGVVHVAEAYAAALDLVAYDSGDVKADHPNHSQRSSGLQVVC